MYQMLTSVVSMLFTNNFLHFNVSISEFVIVKQKIVYCSVIFLRAIVINYSKWVK